MKRIICLLLLSWFSWQCFGQDRRTSSEMLTIYEDNDFLNIRGKGSDKNYTNGFRIAYYHQVNDHAPPLLSFLFPKAGRGSVNTYGWAVTQTMMTPEDLSAQIPDPTDYRYACSIDLRRSLHSTNLERHYNIHSEFLIGVMGPPAMGKETQNGMHKLIHADLPMGWATEYNTTTLANVSVAFEKQFWKPSRIIDVIGGAKADAGTALDAASFYSIIRFGKMNPYFNGLISQNLSPRHSRSWQVYQVFKPSVDFVLYNTLVQGSLFTKRYPLNSEGGRNDVNSSRSINPVGVSFEYTIFVNKGGFSISFTQRWMYAMILHQERQEVGNITLHFAL